jgi:transposase-like protein
MIWVVRYGNQRQPKPHKMKAKRKRHEPEFKARVALEALNPEGKMERVVMPFLPRI